MELKNAEKCHFSEYFFSTSRVIKVEGNTQKPIYWLCSAPKNLKKTQMAPNNMGNTLCIIFSSQKTHRKWIMAILTFFAQS